MNKKASIGSISHGTHRSVDLLGNFSYELKRLAKEEYAELIARAEEREQVLLSDDEEEEESDSELVNELFDALGELAPSYCYFGAHPGDGSDFGFWPDMDSVDELQKFNDLSEVPDDIEDDYVVVNDHGNVSVYGADGTLIWDCV
jgi:hypothetical protein